MAKKIKKVQKDDIIVRKYGKTRVFAQWYNKAFHISLSELNTFTGLSISHGYITETAGLVEKMPKIKKKSKDNGSVSLTVPLRMAWCKDPRLEYEWWRDECLKGTESMLYIGKKAISDNQWIIEKVDVSNVRITLNGEWTSCDLNISFKESPKKWKKGEKEKLISTTGFGKNTRTTVEKKEWNYNKQVYEEKTVYEYTDE